MIRLYPYKVGSRSVRKLRDELNALIIKLEGSRYRHRDTHTVINWGNSTRPIWLNGKIINHPDHVHTASNKLKAFEKLELNDVATVPFSKDKATAQEWLNEGYKIFVRHKLTGHSGEGIEVVDPDGTYDELSRIAGRLDALGYDYLAEQVAEENVEQVLPDALLYTRGVTNTGEYRVHIMNGEVILYQKKSRRVDEDGEVVTPVGEEADVRNLESNWVYRTGNLRRLERVEDLAIKAIEAMGLDFGAVDIVMDTEGVPYVLEVNTAPGLGNTATLEAYAEGFKKMID